MKIFIYQKITGFFISFHTESFPRGSAIGGYPRFSFQLEREYNCTSVIPEGPVPESSANFATALQVSESTALRFDISQMNENEMNVNV